MSSSDPLSETQHDQRALNDYDIPSLVKAIIKKINLNIEHDIVLNDLRTIYLKKIDEVYYNKNDESFDIVIESTIIIDKHDNKKKDYVKIFYKEKVYKYYLNY